MTILNTNRWMRRSPTLRAVYQRYRKTALARACNRAFLVAPRWFRPFSDMSVDRLRAVFDTARELELPVIEMMFHSSELMPNGSPHNLTGASVDDLHARLDQTFAFLAREGVTGVTLGDYAEAVRRFPPGALKRETLACSPADLHLDTVSTDRRGAASRRSTSAATGIPPRAPRPRQLSAATAFA